MAWMLPGSVKSVAAGARDGVMTVTVGITGAAARCRAALSDTRISPSDDPIVPLSLNARLTPPTGSPTLRSTSPIWSGGIVFRMRSSTLLNS